MKVEFKPCEFIREGKNSDPDELIYFIGVYCDGEWSGNVNFVDLPAARVCRVIHPHMGWNTYSKHEALRACKILDDHYRNGEIK